MVIKMRKLTSYNLLILVIIYHVYNLKKKKKKKKNPSDDARDWAWHILKLGFAYKIESDVGQWF